MTSADVARALKEPEHVIRYQAKKGYLEARKGPGVRPRYRFAPDAVRQAAQQRGMAEDELAWVEQVIAEVTGN